MLQKIKAAYSSSFSGLSRETWLLSLVMLVNRAGTMAIPFMSMYVTQAMHRSLSDAGLVITLFGIGSVLGAAAGGVLVDKIGFRPVQIFAASVSGLLFILFAFVTHFQTLCWLTLALSFVAEAFRPANFTAIAAYSKPENITRSNSLNRLAINLGWSIGAGLGGLLAQIDYKLLFFVDGITNLLAGFLLYQLLPNEMRRMQNSKEQVELPPTHIRKPWQDTIILKFYVLSIFFNTAFFLSFRLVPVFWKEDWHLPEWMIGLVMASNGLIVALFEMVLVKHWEQQNKPYYYIFLGSLLVGLAYLLLLLPPIAAFQIAMLAMIFLSIGEMLALPFMYAIVTQRSNRWNRGAYSSGYTLTWSIAQIIGPAGGAWLVEKTSYVFLWGVVFLLCTACALGFRYGNFEGPQPLKSNK